MMQAIIALAETDYRRAAIDAATAAEMALRLAITKYMQQRNRNPREIEQTTWEAKGLDDLFARYSFLDPHHKWRVTYSDVKLDLAKIRNDTAHAGRIPAAKRAIRAVEVAYALVNDLHPFSDCRENSYRPTRIAAPADPSAQALKSAGADHAAR
jgi:hypothetical protein